MYIADQITFSILPKYDYFPSTEYYSFVWQAYYLRKLWKLVIDTQASFMFFLRTKIFSILLHHLEVLFIVSIYCQLSLSILHLNVR